VFGYIVTHRIFPLPLCTYLLPLCPLLCPLHRPFHLRRLVATLCFTSLRVTLTSPPAMFRKSKGASSPPPAPTTPAMPSSIARLQQLKVGVLGGGQLGRMMAQAASRLGVSLTVLDPTGLASPAGQVSGRAVTGSFSDAAAITTLASQVDVLTVEIEHVDADALQAVADAGHVVVHPAPATLKLIQDKLLQKQHLGTVANVALGDFLPIGDLAALLAAGEAWGYPLMLKARKGAYDGRGNAVVSSAQAAAAALASLGGGQSVQLYAERWCPFVRELALMVARSANGQVVAYPVVETVQRENQCHAVIAPARISSTVSAKASAVAEAAIRCLSLTHPFPPYVTAPFPLYITDIFCRSIGDQIARGRGHLWRRAV